MNVVAFCLYGDKPKYCEGMLVNVWLAQTWYPGWQTHVWIDTDVPRYYVNYLRSLSAELHPMDGRFKNRMFYRLLAHDLPGVSRYIVRDADSRIGRREAEAVCEWVEAGTLLHTMHDHPYHIRPIQGGMFGVFNPTGFMDTIIRDSGYANERNWGRDEDFLEHIIWPHFCKSVTEHGRTLPFPCRNEDPDAFVGEIYDEQARWNQQHRDMRNAQWKWR